VKNNWEQIIFGSLNETRMNYTIARLWRAVLHHCTIKSAQRINNANQTLPSNHMALSWIDDSLL
jgi:hypothetical protein